MPCLVSLDSRLDALTLVLWFKDANATGPPIYSIDLRQQSNRSQSGAHFVSGSFVNRFEWIHPGGNLLNSESYVRPTNQFPWKPLNQLNDSQEIKFLQIQPVQTSDAGLYVCRADFRRGRTKYTLVRLYVFGRRKAVNVLK